MRRFSLFLSLGLMFALSAGCDEGGADVCESSMDCDAAEVCVDGTCRARPSPDTGPADAGTADARPPDTDSGPVDAGALPDGSAPDAAMDGSVGDGGFDGGELDAGTDADVDAAVDSGPPADAAVELPPVTVVEVGGSTAAANYACRGARTAPVGGSDEAVLLEASDFFNGLVVEGLSVHAFADNVVAPGCSGACQARVTDSLGRAAVIAAPGGWSAFRVNSGVATHEGVSQSFATVVAQNVLNPAVDPLEVFAVRESTLNTLAAVLLISRQPDQAVVIGDVQDCDGRAVANAVVRVFGPSGEVLFGRVSTEPKRFYFDGSSFPDASADRTALDGLYGAGNVPSGATMRVEIWGRVSSDAPFEMLGCELIDPVPDGVNLIDVGPARMDGPAGCSM